MTRILGLAAMVAALAGFALFLSTVHAAHGLSSVALVLGLAALVLLIPMRRRAPAPVAAAAPVPGFDPSPVPLPPGPVARVWTMIAILSGLGLGILTLRYMYWP